MTKAALIEQIRLKKSFLCIGLDPDPERLPEVVKNYPNPLLEFNRRIITATSAYCVAYKPNTAFYESKGLLGWEALKQTIAAVPEGVLTIADAKRGDIGNTAKQYAEAFFTILNADAVTVNPLMGSDSVIPFLKYPGKWAVLLALTSNPGASDFQFTEDASGTQLYERILITASAWGSPENTMFVAGATRPEQLERMRSLVPNHFLLVPGVGTQGGNLNDVCKAALTTECGLLVNSSRAIIHASSGPDFAESAADAAQKMQQEMAIILAENGFADK